MQGFDRLTTERLTVIFPSEWEDKSDGDTMYFEAPDGTKGFYLALWQMGSDEQRTPTQLVEVFLATDLDTWLEGAGDRELVARRIEETSDSVICTWDTLSRSDGYRVAGKIHARGKYVLRATFHDYDCTEYERSCEYFEPIISSLVLLEA